MVRGNNDSKILKITNKNHYKKRIKEKKRKKKKKVTDRG